MQQFGVTKRSGKKFITPFGLSQVNDDGVAVIINNEGDSLLLTKENVLSILPNTSFRQVDFNLRPTSQTAEQSLHTGSRGKKTDLLARQIYLYDGIYTSHGAQVAIDQFGHVIHPGAMGQEQFYNLSEGTIVTVSDKKLTVLEDFRMPVFIDFDGVKMNLNYQSSVFVYSDAEGKPFTFDQSAVEITGERLLKFGRMINHNIGKQFPLRTCYEGSHQYNDLVNACYEVVQKSLFKFDGNVAQTQVSATSKRKKMTDEDRLEWKKNNPIEALKKAEENWVNQAVIRFLWRTSYSYSEGQIHGKTVSLDAASCRKTKRVDESGAVDFHSIAMDADTDLFDISKQTAQPLCEDTDLSGLEDFFGSEEAPETYLMDVNQANADRDDLLDLQEGMEGYDSVAREIKIRSFFKTLSPTRQDDLVHLLKTVNTAPVAKSYEEASEEAASEEIETEEDKDIEE